MAKQRKVITDVDLNNIISSLQSQLTALTQTITSLTQTVNTVQTANNQLPTILDSVSSAQQSITSLQSQIMQPDWSNQNTGLMSFIKNKPPGRTNVIPTDRAFKPDISNQCDQRCRCWLQCYYLLLT